MAGLNELMKLANKMSGGNVGSKGLTDLMAKINEVAKDVNESFRVYGDGDGGGGGKGAGTGIGNVKAKSTAEKSGARQTQPESAYANQEPDFEDYDGKQDQDGAVRKSRQRDDRTTRNIISNNNTIKKNDIFNFDFNDEKLVEGLIFSEILGKPLGKRSHGSRRGRGRIR